MGFTRPAASRSTTYAQQMQRFGDARLHYIVIPTTTLKPDVAARYNIPRGKDRALCNISVIDKNGAGVKAVLEGSVEFAGAASEARVYRSRRWRSHLLSRNDSSRQ